MVSTAFEEEERFVLARESPATMPRPLRLLSSLGLDTSRPSFLTVPEAGVQDQGASRFGVW